MAVVRHKAAIHSGHFMVSEFEPEEEEEEVVVPPLFAPNVSEEKPVALTLSSRSISESVNPIEMMVQDVPKSIMVKTKQKHISGNQIRFSLPDSKDKDISLASLFRSMSIAYRQRLTSPRWNRFRGLKLRWKDKIRMNNVIWRCWHMQFMQNNPRSLCAFANPMEIDNHDKMEGTTLLEGKYWKRKLETIQKEYKNWRKFYKKEKKKDGKKSKEDDKDEDDDDDKEDSEDPEESHSPLPKMMMTNTYMTTQQMWDNFMTSPGGTSLLDGSRDDVDLQSMLNDEGMIVDLLLNAFQESTSSNAEFSSFLSATSSGTSTGVSSMSVAVPFPNPRDYYKTTTNADLLQPGLGPLQPNLEDIDVDLDWLTLSQPFSASCSSSNALSSLQQPNVSKNVVTRAGNDFLSAVVTATTSQASLSQPQPQQVVMSPPAPPPSMPIMNSPPAPPPPPPSRRPPAPSGGTPRPQNGGGKQRSMLAHQPQIHPSPYPTPSPGKARSPKHRLLQHLQGPQAVASASATSANSELVQLLKVPKPPQQEATEIIRQPQKPQQNGYLYHVGIPPPLATDYQQQDTRHSYRGLPQDHHRRSVHINAEQNRRTSIKHGFEELRALIPSLKDVPASSHKISKAALLHKGGDYIQQMKNEMQSISLEATALKANIEAMEMDVSALQGMLPALKLGVNSSQRQMNGKIRQKKALEDLEQMKAHFKGHVAEGTNINWKYWAFSRLMKPLFESYTESVSGSASFDEMDRSISRWLEDKCSIMQMRQLAVTSLKNISVNTNIIREPHKMPIEALALSRR